MSFFHPKKRYKVPFSFEYIELNITSPLPAQLKRPSQLYSLHLKTRRRALGRIGGDFLITNDGRVEMSREPGIMHSNLSIQARNRLLEDPKSKVIKFVINEVDKGKDKRAVAKGEFDLLHVLKVGVMEATIRLFPASPSILGGNASRELMKLLIRISFNDDDADRASVDTDTSFLVSQPPTPSTTTMIRNAVTTHVVSNKSSNSQPGYDSTDVMSADSHDFTDNTLSSIKGSRDTEDLYVQVNLPTQESLHYQKKLTESQNDAAELQRKLMKITHQHEMNVEKLQSQIRSLQMENDDLEARLDRIQITNTSLNANLSKIQSQLQRVEGEKSQLNADQDALRSKEATLRSALEELQVEKKKIELRYQKKRKEYAKKKKELLSLHEFNDDAALKNKTMEKRMQTGTLCLSFMLLGFACGFLYILSLPFINFQYEVIHEKPPLDMEMHFAHSIESITKKFVMSTVLIAGLSAFGLRFSRRFQIGTRIIDYIMNPYSLATSEMKSQVRTTGFLGFVSAVVLCMIDMFLISKDPLSTSHRYGGKRVFMISFALYQALVEEVVGRVFFFSLCREVMLIISSKKIVRKTEPSLPERIIFSLNEWALKLPFALPAAFSALLYGLFWEMGLFGSLFSIFEKSTPYYSLVTLLLFIVQHCFHAYMYVLYGKIEVVVWLSFVSHMLVQFVDPGRSM